MSPVINTEGFSDTIMREKLVALIKHGCPMLTNCMGCAIYMCRGKDIPVRKQAMAKYIQRFGMDSFKEMVVEELL